MRVLYRTRPYEKVKGSANELYMKWNEIAKSNIVNGSKTEFNKNIKEIIKEFDELPLFNINKPRVGIVGEIPVSYTHLFDSNRLTAFSHSLSLGSSDHAKLKKYKAFDVISCIA